MYYFSEIVQVIGSFILLQKLKKQRNCAGVSLKMQEITAIWIGIRMFCDMTNYEMSEDQKLIQGLILTWLHFILDAILLGITCTIIYMMRTSLRHTYIPELDPLKKRYLVPPCVWLALIVHPPLKAGHGHGFHAYSYWYVIIWATGVYCETISVLPQLRMLQYSKVVESSTAHYIFCLGISRFLVVCHWGIQFIEMNSYLWQAIFGPWMKYFQVGPKWRWQDAPEKGVWSSFVLLSEILQSFLFVDFSFYYVANLSEGGGSLRLPSGMTV